MLNYIILRWLKVSFIISKQIGSETIQKDFKDKMLIIKIKRIQSKPVKNVFLGKLSTKEKKFIRIWQDEIVIMIALWMNSWRVTLSESEGIELFQSWWYIIILGIQ